MDKLREVGHIMKPWSISLFARCLGDRARAELFIVCLLHCARAKLNMLCLFGELCHYVAGARARGEPWDPPPGPMWSPLPVLINPIGLSGRVGPSCAPLGLGLCAGLSQEEGKQKVTAKVAKISCFTATVHRNT